MERSHFFFKEELISILDDIVGKTLGEVDKKGVFERTIDKPKITGIAGDVIEQSVLGYGANQAQCPDLDIEGTFTEVKTTGIRLKKDGNTYVYEAKEPASITAVSINTIATENFENSKFWHKIAHMLFVFYQYEAVKTVPASAYANFHIRGYCFHMFSYDDYIIIRRDWQIIHDFITEIQTIYTDEEAKNEYPNLSTIVNKKLTYLDTAPKFPFAPRFRLRKRVMTVIIQQSFDENAFDKLPNRYLNQSDVEKKCSDIIAQFWGWSMADILEHFDIKVNRLIKTQLKHYAEQVIIKLFGGTAKKISKIEMFRKFGYIGKTITISAKGARTEDTKLESVDFDELTELLTFDEENILREKTFEDSNLFNYFHDNKLLCVLFQESNPDENGKVRLDDNKFIGFKIFDLSDEQLIEEARRTWNDARDTINNGKLKFIHMINNKGKLRYSPKTHIPMGAPNLPKSENYIVFFRGSGTDATNKTTTVNGIKMLRQNYWLKGTIIVDKLKNIPFIGCEQFKNSHKFTKEVNFCNEKSALKVAENPVPFVVKK